MVHDLQWWDSLESFLRHVDPDNAEMQQVSLELLLLAMISSLLMLTAKVLADWVPKYDHSVPFKGHVFGGWTEEVKNVSNHRKKPCRIPVD